MRKCAAPISSSSDEDDEEDDEKEEPEESDQSDESDEVDEGVTTTAIPPNSISLRCIPDFLTASECAHLIALADRRGYHRSTVGHNDAARISSSRTSESSSAMRAYSADAVVQSTRRRAARLAGKPASHVEMSLVRYTSGQRFKPHYDSYELDDSPRQYTIFVYLNDLPTGCGGETHFTRLGFKMTPKCGAALFWENMPSESELHDDAEHAGLPPKEGYTKVRVTWQTCWE